MYSKYGDAWRQVPSRIKLAQGKQKTVSESHRLNRDTGSYDAGGPFYTSRVSYFINPGHVDNAYWFSAGKFYSGPICGNFPTVAEMSEVGFDTTLSYGASNESSLKGLGSTAISQSAPTNPAANLGTTLAETFREGVPSLPGIQSWKNRTKAARAAGSEYLNYQFGWHPLVSEVNDVTNAARHHRDIMNQYHRNEGRNTRRSFHFPSQRDTAFKNVGGSFPLLFGVDTHMIDGEGVTSQRKISRVRETTRWFEGCYTYALPSSTDSWRRGIGFGSDADQLFGLQLTPDVLWELTPWSWAVDWFTNTGDVINNVTNFGLAGLVLRYGYIMEESIETITAEGGPQAFYSTDSGKVKQLRTISDPYSCGLEIVTKRRVPASPFGFSIGWEGLSPTQLAITAALGITKLL